MKKYAFIIIICILIFSFLSCESPDTPKEIIENFALDTFQKFRSIVAPDDDSDTEVKFINNHVEVNSLYWTYILDRSGRQTFRPKSMYQHLETTFSTDIGPNLNQWLRQPVPQSLIQMAKQVVQQTIGAIYDENNGTQIAPARMLIASKSDHSEIKKYHEGTTGVLFSQPVPNDQLIKGYFSQVEYIDGIPTVVVEERDIPPESYETAVTFAPDETVVRIESSYISPEVQEIVSTFLEELEAGSIKPEIFEYDLNLNFGSFFTPREYRFELDAYSWEGEEFLDVHSSTNPWPAFGGPMPWCHDHFPTDVTFVINTELWWSFAWNEWDRWGRLNGIRGNYNGSTQSWERDRVEVIHHNLLEDYRLESPLYESSKKKLKKTCNGHDYGWVDASWGRTKLEKTFYDHLESCHVALLYSHGGFTGGFNTWQFQSDLDLWVKFHEPGDPGLGHGKLRHLFLEACSSICWIFGPTHPKYPQYKNIFSDWMSSHTADGLRTVCGNDGEYGGGYDTGWRFFNSYYQNESISQSWIKTTLGISQNNHPVIIAYGATEAETARTLFDGRFLKDSAGTGWAIALLVWVVK